MHVAGHEGLQRYENLILAVFTRLENNTISSGTQYNTLKVSRASVPANRPRYLIQITWEASGGSLGGEPSSFHNDISCICDDCGIHLSSRQSWGFYGCFAVWEQPVR